jgi:hypothetical protein
MANEPAPSEPSMGTPEAIPPAEEHGESHPRGTFVLMLIFIAVIAVTWLIVYWDMLQRGLA